MLVVHAIQAGQAGYYLGGPGPGRWVGNGSRGLGLAGAVEEPALRAVLAGSDGNGEQLLGRIPSRRRAGFDLVFAAPKSVSLLAGLASDHDRGRITAAHDRAVRDTVGFLERWATRTRRGAEHRRIPTDGLVAAAFAHDSSWSGDPHLHSHVVVANVVEGADGVWSCLDSRSIYRHARAAGAIYQASLRHHLAGAGFAFTWRFRPEGLADVGGVPRPAIDSCSQRRRQILQEIERQGFDGPRARRAAAGRTRRRQLPAPAGSWQFRAAAAGFDEGAASALLAAGAPLAAGPARLADARDPIPPPAHAIEQLLVERGSWFARADAVRAIADLLPRGAPASAVERWTEAFLGGARTAGHGRWTTPKLKRLEAELLDAARKSRVAGGAIARPEAVDAALARRPDLGLAARAAVRRLTSTGAVDLLAPADLVTTAAVLDGARAAWEASGHRVAVLTTDADGRRAAARWQALAGLDPAPAAPHRPTVLIADQADRASTAELHRILKDADARRTKVVLIDGGTRSARREPASPAFSVLRTELGAVRLGVAPHLVPAASAEVVRGGRDGDVTLAPTPTAAAAALVADWYRARAGPSPPVMVAIGAEEAEYLNAAARARRQAAGELKGPAVRAGGREFQVGDEVRALRRDGRLVGVEAGTTGLVTSVDTDNRQVTIRWPATTVALPVADLARSPVTHAYATTPAYVRGEVGPVLALGDMRRAAPRLDATIIYGLAPDGYTPAPPRTPEPLGQALAELGPIPSVPRPEAQRPLPALVAEREAIATQLLTSVPGDARPELRRLAEERAWVEAVPDRPDRTDRLADLDRRAARLVDQADRRARWVEDNRDALGRWGALSEAIATRETALGRAAELRPSRAVAAALGPVPQDDVVALHAWRQAARAIESHRDRWRLPDEPLALAPGPATRGPGRHADELRVLAACRAAERARTVGQERDLAVAGR